MGIGALSIGDDGTFKIDNTKGLPGNHTVKIECKKFGGVLKTQIVKMHMIKCKFDTADYTVDYFLDTPNGGSSTKEYALYDIAVRTDLQDGTKDCTDYQASNFVRSTSPALSSPLSIRDGKFLVIDDSASVQT